MRRDARSVRTSAVLDLFPFIINQLVKIPPFEQKPISVIKNALYARKNGLISRKPKKKIYQYIICFVYDKPIVIFHLLQPRLDTNLKWFCFPEKLIKINCCGTNVRDS